MVSLPMCVGGRYNYLDSGAMVLGRALLAAVAAGGGFDTYFPACIVMCMSLHAFMHEILV
jgi:hypothetical protein